MPDNNRITLKLELWRVDRVLAAIQSRQQRVEELSSNFTGEPATMSDIKDSLLREAEGLEDDYREIDNQRRKQRYG